MVDQVNLPMTFTGARPRSLCAKYNSLLLIKVLELHIHVVNVNRTKLLAMYCSDYLNLLEIQTCCKHDISLDLVLRLLHLFHEFCVSDDSCRIPNLPTSFV